MELSAAEARNLGAETTSTEHILLGIIREGDGVAYRILQNLTPDVDVIRWRVLAESSSEAAKGMAGADLEPGVSWTSIKFTDKPESSSRTPIPDFPDSSAPPSIPPLQNRALEHRKNWLINAPIGLALFGLGLSITLEANNRKNAREPYFWLGTLGLVILNAGLAFLGDAVKSRVLLELESRPRPTSS